MSRFRHREARRHSGHSVEQSDQAQASQDMPSGRRSRSPGEKRR